LSSTIIQHSDPYRPFLPLLTYSQSPEDPIPLLTSAVLTSLLATGLSKSAKSSTKEEGALPKLYTYLSTLAKNQDSGLQDIGVQEYSSLLKTKKSRQLFWKQRSETVNPLVDILRAAVGAGKDTNSTLWSGTASVRTADSGLSGGVGLQLLYHVLLVIWQLSFEGSLIGEEMDKYGWRRII
jgi:V-type H+-transporting ATPase subunit H